MKKLTPEYLSECFDYNPDTGKLKWKQRPVEHYAHLSNANALAAKNQLRAGEEAGTISNGYRVVQLDKRLIKVHRVIYLMQTGYLPQVVDHRDGDPLNNRWTNLRGGGRVRNARNQRFRKPPKYGARGISKRSYGYEATIGGKYIGTFSSLENAVRARRAAERKLGYDPMHGELR